MNWLQRLRHRRHQHPLPTPPEPLPQRDDWLAADPRRQMPGEVTYGSGWVFDDPDDPHSLIWNPGSGELYTHRHRGDTVAVMGTFPTLDEVDTLLSNWEELHDEHFGGYMMCSRIAEHKSKTRTPVEPCFGVVLRVDGTVAPFHRPLTYHDIQTVLGGVALTTADEQQPIVADPLAAAYANAIYLDRNAHRDLKPVNNAGTSLHGGRWPIRGDVVITAWDRQVPLDRSTVDMLLRLPRPPDPTALQEGPQLDIATIPHGDWLQADPRRRSRLETGLWRNTGAFEDPDFLVMFNNGSHELYLLNRRTNTIAELGVFDDIEGAQAVVVDWDPHHAPGDEPFEFEALREHAARASIPIDRDVDHDPALAPYAEAVAVEHDFTVRFNAGRHQPLRLRFERPGVGTHFGRAFTVSGPYVEPSSRADVDSALTDFVDHWNPDKIQLDPDWAQAEADYVADGLEWMQRQLEGENDPAPESGPPDTMNLEEAEANVDTQPGTLTAEARSGTSPAHQVVAQGDQTTGTAAGPDPDVGPTQPPPTAALIAAGWQQPPPSPTPPDLPPLGIT